MKCLRACAKITAAIQVHLPNETKVLPIGQAVTNNREMMDSRWHKSDAKDSANIADLISQGKFMYYILFLSII